MKYLNDYMYIIIDTIFWILLITALVTFNLKWNFCMDENNKTYWYEAIPQIFDFFAVSILYIIVILNRIGDKK